LRRAAVFVLILFFSGCAYYNAFYNAKKYYNEGINLKKKGKSGYVQKLKSSAEKCEKVIAWYPKSKWVDDAIFLLGVDLYELGNYMKAEIKFRELLMYFPHSDFIPLGNLYLGKTLISQGRFEEAMDYINKAYNSKNKEVKRLAAEEKLNIYLEKNENDKVIEAGRDYIKKNPERKVEILKLIGDAYFKKGDLKNAIKYYNELLKMESVYRDSVSLKLSNIYLDLDSLDKALEVLKGNDGIEAQILKGKIYLLSNKLDSSEKVLTEDANVRRDKYGLIGDILLSDLYELKNDTTNELKYLKRAAGLNLDDSLKRFAQIKSDYIETLLKSSQDSTNNDSLLSYKLFLLAESYMIDRGDVETACKLYNRVYEEYPDSPIAPKAVYAVGYLYLNQKNDTTEAVFKFDTLLQKYPETIYSNEVKKLINEIKIKRNTEEKE